MLVPSQSGYQQRRKGILVNKGTRGGSTKSSANSSRSSSPHGISSIPQPKGCSAAPADRVSERSTSRPSSSSSTSSIPHLPMKNSGSSLGVQRLKITPNPTNQAMLDKLKLKEKGPTEKIKGSSGSKRTSSSSSSGFSSARSEPSDSSPSLSSELAKTDTSQAQKAPAARAVAKKSAIRTSNSSSNKQGQSPGLKVISGSGRLPQKSTEDLTHYAAAQVDNGIRQSKISSLVKRSSPRQSSVLEEGVESNETSGSSSIPKPTAAVKGTSKCKSEERKVAECQKESGGVQNLKASLQPPSKSLSSSLPRSGKSGVSVAMVTPIMSSKAKSRPEARAFRTENNASTVTKTATTAALTTSVVNAATSEKQLVSQSHTSRLSVEEQPSNETVKEEVESPEKSGSKGKLKESKNSQEGEEDQEDMISSIQPMKPITRASPYGYTRRLTAASSERMTVVPGLRLQSILPPQPQHHPRKGRLRGADNERMMEAAGYMSDGDVLSSATDDIPSGYLSEGGASFCARRLAANRKKDPKTINVLQDDSFDDSSSSMSSGISDTIAELSTDDNLTGSSLSSEPHNPYDRNDLRPLRRPAVKKTDSCMQTETSAFPPSLSATAWKKYLHSTTNPTCSSADSRVNSSLRNTPHDRFRSDVTTPTKDRNTSSPSSLIVIGPPASSSSVKKGSGSMGAERQVDHKSRQKSKEDIDQRPLQLESPGQSPIRKQSNGRGVGSSNVKRSAVEINGSRLACNGRSGSAEKLLDHPSPRAHELETESTRIYSNIQIPSVPRVTPGIARTSLERKGKLKVCANTQTTSNDLYGTIGSTHSDGEYASLGSRHGLNNKYLIPNATRDRSYVGSPNSDYVFLPGWNRNQQRLTGNDNYVNLDHSGNYAWFRPAMRNNTSSGLTEADSMESLSSGGYSIHAQIQNARANSLTHARLMLHQREQCSSSPRLPRSRSNSVRSTQSEKLYPSMLQRSDDLDPGDGPPSSPASQGGRIIFPSSPVTPIVTSMSCQAVGRRSNSMSHYMGSLLSKSSKEDDVHGSSLSLVSTSSSIYSSAEEKQAHEIRKLKKELDQAHEKVSTLTCQLTTNAHMVAAFEQSLSNMTSRLQHLTASAEQKDSELNELRNTIEALKKQSAEAGLTKMALRSMQAIQRSGGGHDHRISRQLSTDSMSSVNSLSSTCSGQSASGKGNAKKKKKGWLRSSFSKAFSRSKKNKNGSVSDVEDHQRQSDSSAPNSPQLRSSHAHLHNGLSSPGLKTSHSSSAIYDQDEDAPDLVKELRKELREKDMVLTDIRLEALSSAHQLENLKETVNKMRVEMMSLKQDNERLQRLVNSKSLGSSQSSLPHRNSSESIDKRLSSSDSAGHIGADMYLNDALTDSDGKRVRLSVYLGCHGDYYRYTMDHQNTKEQLIGSVCVSGKTKWDLLDNVVKRAFKEYVLRIDPVSNLGLNTESVMSYHIGGVMRSKESEIPELLPCGYLVGDNQRIQMVLKGTKQNSVDAITFETLIPKSIIQRYVSLLSEHRRIILCGPSGTGKTYLAQKLSEFLVFRSGKELTAGSVATFNVDHKSAKELRQYLSNVAEQCENSASDLPTVIILDNLHHVGSLGDVFNGFLSSKYQKCPFIIGTMNQATCSTTNLQLHHNFRWVLCANHMEPVKGFLGRYLRRKLAEEEVRCNLRNNELTKIIDWVPKIWHHLNRFLETHSSSDVTIGPRLFLSCPLDISGSQVWFTDLWNYSIIPYLLEAVREGLQLYGRRAPWEDPTDFVIQTYPWPFSVSELSQLLRLRQEDVGYDAFIGSGMSSKTSYPVNTDIDSDPLLNMLMHLQEAASYSSPQSNGSDSLSLDEHNSILQPEDILTSGVESTL